MSFGDNDDEVNYLYKSYKSIGKKVRFAFLYILTWFAERSAKETVIHHFVVSCQIA